MKITVNKTEFQKAWKKSGLLLSDIAKEVGISYGTMRAIKSGGNKPSPVVAIKIANALEIDPRLIFNVELTACEAWLLDEHT